MTDIVQLFLLALLGSIIALGGGVIFLFNQKWSGELEKVSIPFAAGVLITVSLLGLLPEALEMGGEGMLKVMLAAFFGAYLCEHLIFELHHHIGHSHEGHHPEQNYKRAAPLVIAGDTIHNFIDGVAIGAAYLLSPGLGLITAISTFLHEIPHEVGDFGVLLRAGWKRREVLVVNVISASVTIVGAFSVLVFAEDGILIGNLLAVSAGIFLYLGAADFLPHAAEGWPNKVKAALPMIIGILVIAATLMVVPHTR